MALVKPTKAEINAQKAVNTANSKYKKAHSNYLKKSRAARKYSKKPRKESKRARKKRLRRLKSSKRGMKADKKRERYWSSKLKKAKSKLRTVKKEAHAAAVNAIQNDIKQHDKNTVNEGNCAIYCTNAEDTSVIYIAPTDSEGDTLSTNITSWAVDKGAPVSDYARINGITATASGIITGKTLAEAKRKYDTLALWDKNHYELTYEGDYTYNHLQIESLGSDYTPGYVNNLKVNISFKYVYTAEITTSKAKKHAKSSKSSKSVHGRRHKRYTTVTIRRGNTLWGFSQKYGKSVSWLAKVNHIKNPNLIYPGRKIRVR